MFQFRKETYLVGGIQGKVCLLPLEDSFFPETSLRALPSSSVLLFELEFKRTKKKIHNSIRILCMIAPTLPHVDLIFSFLFKILFTFLKCRVIEKESEKRRDLSAAGSLKGRSWKVSKPGTWRQASPGPFLHCYPTHTSRELDSKCSS